MRVSSTALRHVRELEILVVVESLSIVPVLCCLTHHILELHRLNEIRVPFQVFVSTFPTLHSLGEFTNLRLLSSIDHSTSPNHHTRFQKLVESLVATVPLAR